MTSVAQTDSTHQAGMLDVRRIREMFPILARTASDTPLVYLDSAATTQKPQPVLDTLSRYYAAENANIHRGVYQLSQDATQAYEGARGKGRGVSQRGRAGRDHLHPQRDRGDQPGGADVWPPAGRRG